MIEPLLDEVEHLVLAGDIWQQRKLGPGRDAAAELFEELVALIKAKGIKLTLIRGNHDPESGDGVAWLADRQVLVTHGDAVYDDATPWSREIGRYREEVNEVIRKYAPQSHLAAACADRAKEIANTIKVVPLPKLPPPFNFFATALWPPSRAIEMIRVWRDMGEQGLRFLKHSGEGAKVLICGHFHNAGIWEKDGFLVLNTGAFMKGARPWFVDVMGDKITARRIVLRDGKFVSGEIKGRWLIA